MPYLSARSSPPPTGAAFTGTPFVTCVAKSLIAPKPFRSPKYRCILRASTGGATKDLPRALATSPTAPRYWLVKVVQMSASLYSAACRPRASRSALPSFVFLHATLLPAIWPGIDWATPHQEAASSLTRCPPATRPGRTCTGLPAAGAAQPGPTPQATDSVLRCACDRVRTG